MVSSPGSPSYCIRLENEVTSSTLSSVAALLKSTVGAGVLSLPYAFQKSGAIGGLLICLFVALCEGFTVYVLARFAELYRCDSYTQLVKATLGSTVSASLPVLLVLFSVGDCIAFMMIVGDAFSAIARVSLGDESLLSNRQFVMLVLAVGAVLPMCLAKTLNALVPVYSSAFLCFLYTAAVVVFESGQEFSKRSPDPFEGVVWLKCDVGVLYALPIIVFGFNCHTNVLNLWVELNNESDLVTCRPQGSKRRSVKMNNMLDVVIVGLGLTLLSYVVMGFAGYVGLLDVSSNILVDLPDTMLVQVARVVMAFIILAGYPLSHFPAREGFQDALCMSGWEAAAKSESVCFLFTLAFVSGTTAIAMVVTDLGVILSLFGGTVATFFIFVIPGMMLVHQATTDPPSSSKARQAASSEISAADAEAPEGTSSLAACKETAGALSAPLLDKDEGSGGDSSPSDVPTRSFATHSLSAGVFLIVLGVSIGVITVYTSVTEH
eukprot:gene23913-9484_t